MAGQLQIINSAATALIAFIAGLTLNFERLGRRITGITRMLATTLGVAMLGLFAVAWLAWSWLPVAPEAAGMPKVAMVALFVIIVISFSPTMTAAVISETGARGRLSDLVLAIVVLSDLVVLVLFSLAMQLTRVALSKGTGTDVNMLVRLAWEIGGAAAFGCLVGALFALYLRFVAREVTLVLLGVCALLIRWGSRSGSSRSSRPWPPQVIQNVSVPQATPSRWRSSAARSPSSSCSSSRSAHPCGSTR